MSKELFLIATSTDVEKIFTVALIVKKLRGNGLNARCYKKALKDTENIKEKLGVSDAKYICGILGITDNPKS